MEDSSVSEMTQVIAAIMQMGWNKKTADEIYASIGRIINLKVNEYIKNDSEALSVYKLLTDKLAKNFSNQSVEISLASTYLNHIMETINSEQSAQTVEDYSSKTPFDSSNLFKIFTSAVTGSINKEVIKRTFSGLGAVISPAHDSFTIYDTENGPRIMEDIILNNISKESMDITVQIGEIVQGDTVSYIKDGIEIVKKVVFKARKENEISLYDFKN